MKNYNIFVSVDADANDIAGGQCNSSSCSSLQVSLKMTKGFQRKRLQSGELKCLLSYNVPGFEEDGGAYYIVVVSPFVCPILAISQERLQIGS